MWSNTFGEFILSIRAVRARLLLAPLPPLHAKMSDEEFIMDDAADEDYDFEYEEDDEDIDDADAGVENRYYNAKTLKDTDPDDAIREFQAVVDAERRRETGGSKRSNSRPRSTFIAADTLKPSKHTPSCCHIQRLP